MGSKRQSPALWSATATAVCIAAAAYFAYHAGRREREAERASPRPIDVTIVEQRVASISELATVSYSYTDLASHEKSEKLWGMRVPFSTSRILLRYNGEIKAGVDMRRARVTVEDTTITIFLPPSEVLSHSVDPSSIKILNLDNGLFSSIRIEDFTRFCAAHKDSMEARAVSNGLLTAANARATESLEIIAAPLRDMGYAVAVKDENAASGGKSVLSERRH